MAPLRRGRPDRSRRPRRRGRRVRRGTGRSGRGARRRLPRAGPRASSTRWRPSRPPSPGPPTGSPRRSSPAAWCTSSAAATAGSSSRRCGRATAPSPASTPSSSCRLTFHNLVVGANGQRQAMFLENVSGLAERILRNYDLRPPDSALVCSSSGCNVVPMEMAEGFRSAGSEDRGHREPGATPKRARRDIPRAGASRTSPTSSSTPARPPGTRWCGSPARHAGLPRLHGRRVPARQRHQGRGRGPSHRRGQASASPDRARGRGRRARRPRSSNPPTTSTRGGSPSLYEKLGTDR